MASDPDPPTPPAPPPTGEASHERRDWLRVTLASIGDAVISTDAGGNINFMNSVAESLTGWGRAEAADLPLDTVFRVLNEESRRPVGFLRGQELVTKLPARPPSGG